MVELTQKDIEFFKTEGYLVKRNVLNPELMERARTRLWDGAPEGRRRDDPETWIGPFTAEEENIDKDNNRRGFRWNFREPGGEAWMVQLLATDPNVWGMAEQFLGKGNLVQPDRVRGIYCTLPYGDVPKKSIGCHVDAHPFHLGAVGYIDDVPPKAVGLQSGPGAIKSSITITTPNTKTSQHHSTMLTVSASAEVQALNATVTRGMSSSGIIVSGMLLVITIHGRFGRQFCTISAK